MDYRQLVRQTAEKYGLDPNLAEAVMQQESGGRPNAVSPAGAVGLMQLMPGTARDLGVDPTDPMQNIDGGVRYLKQQIDKFGVAGGLAAYNAGPGRVMKIGGQFNALPAETQNYVPSVMNRTAVIAEQAGGGEQQVAEVKTPTLDIPTLIGGYEKAQAAKDTEATNEIGGLLKQKFDSALTKARMANDTEAVKEIEGLMGKYGIASQPPAGTPEIKVGPNASNTVTVSEPKSAFRRVDDFVRGIADTATFGYADEIAGKLDSLFGGGQSGKTNYQDAVKAQRERDAQGGVERVAGQLTGAVLPVAGTVGVVRAAPTASRLVRGGAGAATGAIQGGLYGSGSADEGDRLAGAASGATVGALTGGVLGSVLPATARQVGNRIIDDAGNPVAARMDAEIIQDLNKLAGGANQRGTPVGAVQLNALENKYLGDVTTALKGIGRKNLEAAGLKADDISNAIRDRRIIGEDQLNALRQTKAGTALADSIEKAQRTRSLTAAVPAATNPLARAGRAALDILPIPQPVRYAGQRILGSRQTREDVAQRFISPKMAEAAADVTKRLGPSNATNSLAELQQMAAQAQAQQAAQAQARVAARSAARAPKVENPNALVSDLQGKDPTYLLGLSNQLGAPRNADEMAEFSKLIRQQMEARVARENIGKAAQQANRAAQEAATRNSVLQETRRPLGGGFQELLEGGRAGTNLQSRQAIEALRTLKRKGGVVGDAADQILKSRNVTNEDAFYGLQNAIRTLQERGAVQSAATASKQATAIAGKKGSEISRVIYGLPDDQVAALAGRSTDTMGQSIGNLKGYLTTRASRAYETAKKNPESVLPEDRDLLRALGIIK
jgi:hypothetical protein